MTASRPCRFQLGEEYRPSQLKPGVVVIRQVSHSATAVSSGSPCCLRTSTIDHEAIAAGQRHHATYGVGGLRHPRKCSGCGARYDILIAPDASGPLLRTVAWEVRP